MTPGARIQAVIDLVSGAFLAPGGQPPSLDRAIKAFFRTRRYAGSKDRRFVRDLVWDICRQRGLLTALTGQDWQQAPNARLLVLAYLWRQDGGAVVQDLCNGEGHAPAALSEDEHALLSAMADQEPPDWAWVNLPAYLDDILSVALGKDYAAFHAAMDQRAPTVLRCNGLKSDRDAVKARLAQESGDQVLETRYSPMGLLVDSGKDLSALPSFKKGLFDIQDEAAQLACLYAGLEPGMTVLDYCAGGGGKALALASLVPDHGGIDCHDRDARRMKDINSRADRAGATGISVLQGKPKGQYDLVLVDAPCSGSGVWRRHPDDRWRWSQQDIAGFVSTQKQILDDVAGYVKPGGRLVYMTCSVLVDENGQQKKTFLKNHKDFTAEDVKAPDKLVNNGDLVLRPDLQDCDGFYMAQFVRTG